MNGFNVAEAGHVINALGAVSISGGKTTLPIHMGEAEHVSFIISFGVMGVAVPTALLLYQCADEAGNSQVAIPFRYYYQGTTGAGHDVLDHGPLYAAATGVTTFPASVAGLVYVIEVDSAEVMPGVAAVGTIVELPYLYVSLTDSGNVTLASIIAIQSGLRHAGKASPSVTV